MWGRNTRVVVIPSILVIGLLGQSTHYPHLLIPADISKLPLAFWAMYTSGLQVVSTTHISYVGFVAGLFISIAMNALMTALIVFKILKVFWQVKTISDDQILVVTGGSTVWRILFVIIESGIVLLFIQVFRIVALVMKTDAANNAYSITVSMHNAFNVIIRSVHCYCFN